MAADEPAPFTVINADGSGGLVLVCDHADNRVPRSLNNLGLSAEKLSTHIAWDPGAALVARALANKLDAPLVLSGYSRLVIDCNRPLESPESMPEQSAGEWISGNRNLSQAEMAQRIEGIFNPYQRAITGLLEQRNLPTALLGIHSFTPCLNGEHRPWQVGVAFYQHNQLALALHRVLQRSGEWSVGLNQPYAIESKFDYTLPVQGEARGIPSAMVEIRQDEIDSIEGAERWAERLAGAWREVQAGLATGFVS